jgi:hypothetical protein
MSYTLAYKRTYEEWINEKSKRIYNYLKYVYEKGLPIDFQDLAFKVYFERLFDYRKALWKPYQGRFLDLKPSPFIRNFLYFLCDQLKIRGYLLSGYIVEIKEPISILDFEEKVYDVGKEKVKYGYVVKIRDSIFTSDFTSNFKKQGKAKIIEIREYVFASDFKIEHEIGKTKVRIYFENRLIGLPTLEEIKDICVFHPDPF